MVTIIADKLRGRLNVVLVRFKLHAPRQYAPIRLPIDSTWRIVIVTDGGLATCGATRPRLPCCLS